MRLAQTLPALLGLLTSVGCQGAAERGFTYQGGTSQRLHGVAYVAPGVTQVAMGPNLCEMDNNTGLFGTDEGYGGGSVQIDDSGKDADGKEVILVTTATGVYVKTKRTRIWLDDNALDIDPELFDLSPPVFFETGPVQGAQLNQDGLVVLKRSNESCQIASPESELNATIDPPFCRGPTSLRSDLSGPLVFLGSSRGVLRLQLGEEPSAISTTNAELLEYDANHQRLYATSLEGTQLVALRTNGEPLWSLTLDAPITALRSLNTRDGLLVASGTSDGLNQVLRLDGASGDTLEMLNSYGRVESLEASEDGLEFALTHAGGTEFFAVRSALQVSLDKLDLTGDVDLSFGF